MSKYSFILYVAMLSFSLFGAQVKADEYRLAPQDVINIQVWGYEELQLKEVPVRPDGKISFPLVGEVVIAGLTSGEAAKLISTSLSDYIKIPQVTLNVLKFHTTRVYVLGEVNKPGLYELERSHNLLDAIGAAGGYTKNAAKKTVSVWQKDTDKPLKKANLLDLLQKGDIAQNYVLLDGDIVYLSDNGKINFASDILPWISATYQVVRIDK